MGAIINEAAAAPRHGPPLCRRELAVKSVIALLIAAALGWFFLERSRRRTSPMAGGLHDDISLPHTQEWELFHNSFSLCSKKLRVCMAELGLAYASHPIDLIETGSYENVSRRYLAVNPAGLVPVLLHRGHPIYESHEEIVYAARHAGERGRELLPDDAETRALVERFTDVASMVGADPTQGTAERAGNCIPGLTVPLFATMVRYIPLARFAEGLLFHPQKRRPLLLALLKLAGIHRLPRLASATALISRSRRDMERHLDALGEQLEKCGGPWIVGDRFTLADVSWVVILDRLAEADWDEHFWGGGKRPAVAAYWQRLQARPSFEAAIVRERCQTLRDGAADVKAAKREDAALRAMLEGAA
jgi:glutathione S-transferase